MSYQTLTKQLPPKNMYTAPTADMVCGDTCSLKNAFIH